MIYHVRHTTTYDYSEPVALCHNLVHLAARSTPHQTCLSSLLEVQPEPAVTGEVRDFFDNPATFFTVQEPHHRLTVTAENVTRVLPSSAPGPADTPPWEAVRDLLARERTAEVLDAYQFAFDSPYIKRDAELADYARPSFPAGRPLLAAALDLTRRIHTDFRYDKAATTVATPLREVLRLRRGVCQDFAHFQIGCLRSLGLAARYVSGYLLTQQAAGEPRLVGADASHAWLAVYCPGHGWLALDPTNDLMPAEKHILLAWGRDYDDVSPVKGVILGGGQHTVHVAVDVVPLTREPHPVGN
jgi:transglutaminase-like putative cysteine protease